MSEQEKPPSLEQDQHKPAPLSLKRLLLYSAIAVVLVLGALELILAVALPVLRTATLPDEMIKQHLSAMHFRYDPDLYWYPKVPDGVTVDPRAPYVAWRRAVDVEKKPGIKRVITMGDSQTQGVGVGPGECYSDVAAVDLGEGWEVGNAAVPGYRSLNIYRMLQLKIVYYRPDVVVVDSVPFDSPRDDGPVQSPPFASSFVKRILWHSRIYYVMRYAFEKLRADHARWLDQNAHYRPNDLQKYGNHDLIAAWCRARGIRIVFLEYPTSTVDWKVTCMTHEGELPQGVPVVPACRALEASGYDARELFMDRNHMTVLGNEIVGHALADTLRSLE